MIPNSTHDLDFCSRGVGELRLEFGFDFLNRIYEIASVVSAAGFFCWLTTSLCDSCFLEDFLRI